MSHSHQTQECTTTTTVTRIIQLPPKIIQIQPDISTLKIVEGNTAVTVVQGKKKISGTELHGDTWYRVTLKAGGILTWAVRRVKDTFNHAQIVYGSATKAFLVGGNCYQDAQWKLEESEEPGFVSFVNRAQPNAVLTWAGNSPSGHYVVLYLDQAQNKDYLPGGKFRADCLWKIVPEEGAKSGHYLILNKAYVSGYNGIVTWSAENYLDSQKFVQLYNKGSPDSYKHNADYLWTFDEIAD